MNSDNSTGTIRRKIRLLWIGLGTYFLIFLSASRFATKVSYQIFVLGALINGIIIVAIILAMRRAYKRLNE
jgi:hypothetical protein